jgi:hypothetical protein
MAPVRLPLAVAALAVAAFLAGAACGPSINPGTCEGADLLADPDHCGACFAACDDGEVCRAGVCEPGEPPECTPGAQTPCYTGPIGTEGRGPCRAGVSTCTPEGRWGLCMGQVLPTAEVCGNGIDDNCNGEIDEEVDLDGDGFTTCGGDCCDSVADGCLQPELVNPGAFEVPGNLVDDDCDGVVDNAAATTCDAGLPSNASDPFQYAAAMELCQTASESDTRWGVISARLIQPSGSGTPNANQRAIRPSFGATTVQGGASFVVLSTGHAAAPGQTNPPYVAFQGGVDLPGPASALPSDWLLANGNALPNVTGCPAPQGGLQGHDAVMLELRIRTPTNARSFRLSTNFFSSEYPEWVCSPFNDFFIVLLDSAWNGNPPNPADKNLAVYTSPQNVRYPVGVNLGHGNTGLFTVCKNGPTGCGQSAVAGSTNSCVSTAELVGTGMDVVRPGSPFEDEPGYCGSNDLLGGGTGWLTTQGNVVGGEIIRLRIAMWDTGDSLYDSVALIDNFQWSVEASEPGTVIDVD